MAIATLQSVTARRWDDGIGSEVRESLAEEVPVALSFNGQPYAVMMATPADLADFALGFAITEGLIDSPAELLGVASEERDGGIALSLQIPGARLTALLGRERNLAGRTGCGLCGTATLEAAIRPVSRVQAGDRMISRAALLAGMQRLSELQPLNASSGALHAAVIISSDSVFTVREDVGRHNAIDKAVGAALGAGRAPRSLLVTSRASYEVLHKAAEAGCNVVAAVSAPTALALRLAQQSGMTLVGWARPPRLTLYCGELA
jgi:formate dehydrogenase accessory protein FdhD